MKVLEYLTQAQAEILSLEGEVSRKKDQVTHLESVSAKLIESIRRSEAYTHLTDLKEALKVIQEERTKLRQDVTKLKDVLDALQANYNPKSV